MGTNFVQIGEEVVVDLTNDSVTPETLAEGETAHNAKGNLIRGTMTVYKNLTLGVHTDGLLYIFSNGQPIGTGVEMPDKVGDIYGTVDSGNTIVLKGYVPNGTYTFKFEMDNGTVVSIGSAELDNNVYYAISKKLTYCTISNSATKVVEGGSYTATITAKDGYKLKTVTATMNGSSTGVTISGDENSKTITIASVTGNIVISAVAEVKEVAPTYTNIFNHTLVTSDLLNKRVKSDGSVVDCTGYFIVPHILISDKVPFTDSTKIYVKGATFDKSIDDKQYAKVLTYKNKASTGYGDEYSAITYGVLNQKDEGNGVISVSGSYVRQAFPSDTKYVAFCLKVKDTTITASDIQNIVITIDEPIV